MSDIRDTHDDDRPATAEGDVERDEAYDAQARGDEEQDAYESDDERELARADEEERAEDERVARAEDEDDDDDEQADDDDDGDGDESDERPMIVDESAYASDDDEDDEDFGHLARLVDDEEESADTSAEQEPAEDPEIPVHLIDQDALWVVKRLRAKGYEAYLTGGCVRDLLLGIPPKDFDVATAAHPNQVKSVFRNCRLIGRRFRLAHVYFPNGKVIETATFRANPLDELEDLPEDLLVERDNVFGTVEDDARRRDLTINGLFYDPLSGKVIDYVDGRRDLELRLIRTIGDPQVRFQEDPVRIMRAIKFATRLGFDFEEETKRAMQDHVGELVRCAPPRLQEELLRLLTSKYGLKAWELCLELGVAQTLLPELMQGMSRELAARSVASFAAYEATRRADEEGADAEGDESAGEADEVEAADATPAEEPGEAPDAAVASDETPATEPEAGDVATIVAPAPPPTPLTPAEREARLLKLLASMDEVRRRDGEISTAVVWATLLLPVWEAYQQSDEDGAPWVDEACNAWTERLRMTRRDRDTLWLLLKGLDQLRPSGRRGHAARHMVSRPWFKESLLLYTLALHAAGQDLEEVGRWKAIAQHYEQGYRQPRVGERPARSGGGGRDRDGKRGRRSRRGGGGGGGGGRGRGRRRGGGGGG